MGISRRLLLGASTAAAIGTAARAQRPAADVFRFVPQSPLPALDPVVATTYPIRNHGYMVYDTLFATDAEFKVRPQMVEAWETAPDGLRWTFRLRPGLVFHDGAPVRAADCIASLRRWSARDAFGQTLRDTAAGYDAVDERTFAIRLSKPFPLMLQALGKLSSNVPFIMPERIAASDPAKALTEVVGSGPFRFMAADWVPGQSSFYERFDGYVPRQEPPSWAAGGKAVRLSRVEWRSMPDPATAAAALQTGEVDWYDSPAVDLLPLLRRNRAVTVANRPLGTMLMLRFNSVQPPFDNVAVRRAVEAAVRQDDYMQAVAGDPAYYKECKSFFTCGTPMASDEGADAMPGDFARAKAMLAASGYKGERVVLLSPTDLPSVHQQGLVTQDLLTRLGMNVDFIATDWASMVGRRNNRGPVDQGGWSLFHTFFDGTDLTNPAIHIMLRTNGTDAWLGWPSDPAIEALRTTWLNDTSQEAQVRTARDIQSKAFQSVPYVPLGFVSQPTAYRADLKGMVSSPIPFFWEIAKT